MSTTQPTEVTRRRGASATAESALSGLLEASLHFVNGKLEQKTQRWAEKLDAYETTRGPKEQAAYQGAKAGLQRRNAIWAGLRGAWAGANRNQKLGTVLLLLAFIVLAPVPTIILILGLLIALLVKAIRAASR